MLGPTKPPLTPTADPSSLQNTFPAWTLALIGIAGILAVGLCACCCCLVLLGAKRQENVPRGGVYLNSDTGKSPRRSVPVRNRLVTRGRDPSRVPYYNAPWDINDDLPDDRTMLANRDEKRLQAFSDILRHADYLNVSPTLLIKGIELHHWKENVRGPDV